MLALPAGQIGDEDGNRPLYDFGQNARLYFQNYYSGNDYPLLHELRMVAVGDLIRCGYISIIELISIKYLEMSFACPGKSLTIMPVSAAILG